MQETAAQRSPGSPRTGKGATDPRRAQGHARSSASGRRSLRAALGTLGAVAVVSLLLAGCAEDSTPPPVLVLAPQEIQLAPADSAASFEISNGGRGTLSWELLDDAPWLAASGLSGSTGAAQIVSLPILRDSLFLGPTVARVDVSSSGGGGQVTVRMWTALLTEPTLLDLGEEESGLIEISNLGPDTLQWSASSDQDWVEIDPPAGRLLSGRDTLRVAIVPSGLLPGSHEARIRVDAGALGRDTTRVQLLVPSVVSVSGHTYYAQTLIPVPAVRVSIGTIADTTDGEGRYTLANVPVGSRLLEARGVGLDPYAADLEIPEAGLTFDLALTSPLYLHEVSGTVRNNAGAGIHGARGTLLNPDASPSALTALSAADGSYRLAGVPEGRREILWTHYYYETRTVPVDVLEPETRHDPRLVARAIDPPWAPNGLRLKQYGCLSVSVGWELRFEEAFGVVGGYLVERATSPDGPFLPAGGTVPAGSNVHVDAVPTFGRYFYRVRTENIDGIAGVPTDHSHLTLNLWTLLNPGTADDTPHTRSGHSLLHDLQGNRVIMFAGVGCVGGQCGIDFKDTWALDLATYTWEKLDAGTGPGERGDHVAIHDAPRRRMVVFAGYLGSDGVYYNDTWAYDLSPGNSHPWTRIHDGAGGPAPRRAALGVYTGASDDRLVIHGGRSPDGMVNDVWAFDLAAHTWERLLSGAPGEQTPQPQPRYLHAGVYDSDSHRLVFCGGQRAGELIADDTWALDLTTLAWTRLTDGPGPRFGHSAIHDPFTRRLIVFGGRAEGDQFYGDTQALALEGAPYWEELSGGAAGSGPGARYFHAAVLDPLAGRMIIFGGLCGSDLWSDTWAHCGIR